MYQIVAWLVMLIAFAILEGLTAALVSIWFCIGAVAALIAAALGIPLQIQIALFALVSLACMLLIRPLTKKYLVKNSEPTNADRIISAEALVTETINNLQAKGQIRVHGEYWTARSEGEEEIPEGAQVRILRIEGVKAIVMRID
jgi:membrane protein implicated in regulation of membrane protease activity